MSIFYGAHGESYAKNQLLSAYIFKCFRWMILSSYVFSNENLFRLIFETQIHIWIHLRYFKSLPNATYYLITIHTKSLFTRPRRESKVRYKFHFNALLQAFECR